VRALLLPLPLFGGEISLDFLPERGFVSSYLLGLARGLTREERERRERKKGERESYECFEFETRDKYSRTRVDSHSLSLRTKVRTSLSLSPFLSLFLSFFRAQFQHVRFLDALLATDCARNAFRNACRCVLRVHVLVPVLVFQRRYSFSSLPGKSKEAPKTAFSLLVLSTRSTPCARSAINATNPRFGVATLIQISFIRISFRSLAAVNRNSAYSTLTASILIALSFPYVQDQPRDRQSQRGADASAVRHQSRAYFARAYKISLNSVCSFRAFPSRLNINARLYLLLARSRFSSASSSRAGTSARARARENVSMNY